MNLAENRSGRSHAHGRRHLALALRQTGSLLAPDFYQTIEVPGSRTGLLTSSSLA